MISIMKKCRSCSSLTEYEVCGNCIKCPLCGGPSINGESEQYRDIFLRKNFYYLSGECPKCRKDFLRKWEMPEGRSISEATYLGAFVHNGNNGVEQVEDILKKPPAPPSSVNLKRFQAIDSDNKD